MTPPSDRLPLGALSPREMYLREKERRARRLEEAADPLADARREYEAQLAADVAAGRGGRPKKNAAKPGIPKGADEHADEELGD